MEFDVQAALNDGATDEQIAEFLCEKGGYDYRGMRSDGFGARDIYQNILAQNQPEPSPEPVTEESGRTIMGTMGDIGLSAVKGVVSTGEAVVGLADIVTMGHAGKAAHDYLGYDPQETHKVLDSMYSPAQQTANKKVENAHGFVDTVKTAIQNPSTIGHAVIQSAPLMGGGGAIGRGVVAGVTRFAPAMAKGSAAIYAAAVGEGAVGAGSAAESTRQQTPDGLLTPKQAAISVASGIGTGAFNLVGGRLANKLGIADVDTMLVQGGSNVTKTGVAKRIIGGGISEGVFEELPQSVQEQIWANAAMDKQLLEGVPESAAMGLLTGGVMGVGANLIAPHTRQNLLDKNFGENEGFGGEDLSETPYAEDADKPYTDLGDIPAPDQAQAGSQGPSEEEQQWIRDIEAQRAGTYQSDTGVPIQDVALRGQQRRQRAIDSYQDDIDQQEAQEQEALNSPGAAWNQGQETIDRNINEFRRVKQQEKEIRAIGDRRNEYPEAMQEQAYWKDTENDIKAQQQERQAREAEAAKKKQYWKRESQRIEGKALAGWQAPEPKSKNALTRAELAKRKAYFAAKARELGDDVSAGTDRNRQPVEREIPRGIPTPAFGQPRAIGGAPSGHQVGTKSALSSIKTENSLITEQDGISEQAPGSGKELTYEKFKEQYTSLFNEGNKYTPDQVGSQYYSEKMAELSDQYPGWADKVEDEAYQEYAASNTPATAIGNVKTTPIPVQQPKTPEAKAKAKEIKQEVKKVDTAPTDAQKEAGNYKKGHIKIEGFDISVENPDGSTRSGIDNDGNTWESRMHGHYGYFKRTKGNDGDHVDVVVAPGATASPKVFVVDQVDPDTFDFDEHKVMMGVESKEEAEALYLSNYADGWEGFGGVTEMTPDEFRTWVKDEKQTGKPLYKERIEDVPTEVTPKKGGDPGQKGRSDVENDDGYVGLNSDGQKVYEDDRGVRSYEASPGLAVGQSVSIIPGSGISRDSKELLHQKGKHEFLTVDEIAGFEKVVPEKSVTQNINEEVRQSPGNKIRIGDHVKAIKDVSFYGPDPLIVTHGNSHGIKVKTLDGKSKGGHYSYSDFEKVPSQTPPPTPKEKDSKPAGYGKKNKVFTEDAAAKAREILRKKFNTQLNAGLDPEMVQAGITLAGYHIEAGARTFIEYSKAMIEDLGEGVKPYLRSFYEGARYFPGMDSKGMTEGKDVDNLNLDKELAATNNKGEQNGESNRQDNERGSGVPGVGPGTDPAVSGRRDGDMAGDGVNKTDGHDNVLETPLSQAAPESQEPGDTEADGIRERVQGMGTNGQGRSSGDEQVGREADGGTSLDADGSGGVGRGRTGRERLGNYHIENPENLIGGTPKVRFKKNQKAIETFNNVLNESRKPTSEERDAIAAYIGWGSFGQDLFKGSWDHPIYKDGWKKENDWLREHLGEKAWKSAQASIINAHYTDPPTVSALWNIAKKLGFKGGRVLEPSMGIGNFFGLMPKDLKDSSDLTGIELDETTAEMARMLYPDANIQQMGYEKSKTADGFYDLVIGNWPFAADGPADRRYNKYRLSLHDYFFVKALDQVREGGLVIGITSSGTMDKKGRLARRQMEKRGNLIASFRMPMGAFKEYAGTSVVADILVFQKHDGKNINQNSPSWMENTPLKDARGEAVTIEGRDILVNEYWEKNPDNVLGNMTVGHGTTQGRPGMIVERKNGYENILKTLSERLPSGIMTKRNHVDNIQYISNNTQERQGSITITKDGKLYVVKGERLAPLNDEAKYSVKNLKTTEKRKSELKALVHLRNKYGELMDAERNGEDGVEKTRKELNQQYNSFVEKYGQINNSFSLKHFTRAGDPMAPALAALESNTGTKEKPVYKPAMVLKESTQRAKRTIDNPSISDAFVLVRNDSARTIDIEAVAKLAKTTPEAVKKELFGKDALFETPVGTYEVKDIYLSGDVRQKLRDAEDAQANGIDMERNIKALKEVMPADVPYFSIETNLGATWIPAEVYQQFICESANIPTEMASTIKLTSSINGWIVKYDDAGSLDRRDEARTLWSVPGASFTRIVRAAFTGQAICIKARDEDGNEFTDTEASARANEKVDTFREALKDWIWKDVDRRVNLEKHYNEVMNAWATPEYDGSFLSFDGMMLKIGKEEFNLRQHQVNAIWRGVANGRGLYAHEVGTGKTFTMGGIAIESRRYGIAKKPLILAHNANSASVAGDIQGMYPGAKVLYIDNLTPATIDQKLYQIANDDWDAVVLPHSLIDRLTLSRETLDRLAADEIAALEEDAIASAEEEGFDIEDILDDEEALRKVRGATTAKELVKQRNRIIANIEKQAQAASRENAVLFENLGLDMIIIDEAHEFKKPPMSTRMKVKGLNTASSNRSIALNFLTSYIKEGQNGKGVHIFTGTPITNTLNEIYNHMRYVMSDEMERADVLSWDAWFNTFASVESDIERTASGEYEAVSRLAGFHNVSELRRFAGQFMDIVFADDMPEFVPRAISNGKTLFNDDLSDADRDELLNGRVDTGEVIGRPYKKLMNEVAEMSQEQRSILEDIIQRSNSFKNATGRERRQIMLSGDNRNPVIVETDAAKAGFDPRLYDKNLSDHPDNKINRCVAKVLGHYAEHEKASQVIFMEKGYNDTAKRSMGRTDGGDKILRTVETFNAAKDIQAKLVEGGIPAKEIAIVNGKVTKKKRKEIADKVNSGEIRVVIGLTATLGTGVNMQENLRAMHHLDAPWMPGELEQRNGRGHRQGNRWNTVYEYRYITDNIDARRWQILAKKQKMIIDFLKAKDGVRSIEGDAVDLNTSDLDDINASFSEAAGDARILIREKLKKDIDKLERKKRTHDFGIVEAKNKAKDLKNRTIPEYKARLENLKEDMDHFKSIPKDSYSITIEGETFTNRKDAGIRLERVVLALKAETDTRGVTWDEKIVGEFMGFEIVAERGTMRVNYSLDRKGTYPINPSIGSIDATLRNLPKLYEKSVPVIQDKETAMERFEQVAKEPFAQEETLKNKQDLLKQVEADLAQNPDAPPSWLAQGAPIGTNVHYKGKEYEVEGHKNGKTGFYILIKDGEKHDAVSYLDVMDENNLPVYEAREGDTRAEKETRHPDIGAAGFGQQKFDRVGLVDPLFSTKASSDQEPAVTLTQIKEWFPGQTVGVNPDGSTWIRLSNGAGLVIRNVEQVSEGKYLISTESGKMDQNGVIAGKYSNNQIELVDGVATGKTLSHEIEHWLEDIGLITALDKSVLDTAIDAMSKKGDFNKIRDQGENRANFLAQYLADRKQFRGKPMGIVLQKIGDFLDGLLNLGRASVRKIAQGIESGETFSREADGEKGGEDQYSTVSNETKKNEAIVKSLFHQDKTLMGSIKSMANMALSKDERALARGRFIALNLDNLHFIKTRLGDKAYRMHRVLTGITSATFSMILEHGALSWDEKGEVYTVKTKNKGILPFLKSIGPDYEHLLYWIAAKRAEVLDAEGRENWITKDKRDAIFALVGTHSKAGKAWGDLNRRFQTINKNILDLAEQAGLIDPDARAQWESDFYIPFYRIFEDPVSKAEFLSGPAGAKKHITSQIRQLKGGDTQVGDLLQNSLKNWMYLLDAAARNRARATAFESGVDLDIIQEVEKKDLINVLGSKTVKQFAVMKAGGKRASALLDTEEEAEAWAYSLADKTGKEYSVEPRKTTIVKFGSMKDLGVFSFQRDGQPVYFKTDDQDLYESLCEIDNTMFKGWLMQLMGKAKRGLSFGATVTPLFRINNMLRDTLHTSIVSGSFVPVADSAIGFCKAMYESKEYREFMASGFGFGSSYVHSEDPEAGAKFLKKVVKREGRGAIARIITSPAKLFELWEKIGSASENAARVQLYSKLKRKGMSTLDAGFEGRDLLDFSKHGSGRTAQMFIRIIPFLNARFQGLYKLGQSFKEKPLPFLVKSAILTSATLALWGAYKDDDRYKELEDWDKWSFFHFWWGGKHYRIPKPFEIGAIFCSLPESIGNVMNGTEDKKFLADWAEMTARSVFSADIPQLFKPVAEAEFANKNTFTGREVVPKYMEGLPKADQYHPWTSETAREIGKQLNMSPLKIQHYVKGYAAGLGTIMLTAMDDFITRDAFDYPERPAGDHKPWTLGRLVEDENRPARSTKYLIKYYEMADEIRNAQMTFNNHLRMGDGVKAKAWLQENGRLMAMAGVNNDTKKKLSAYSAEMKRVQRSKKYSAKAKQKRIDMLTRKRNELVKARFNAIHNALKQTRKK